MKKGTKLLAVGVVTLALSSPVLAMQPADELKGKEIRNQQGEEIGTIEDVLINPQGTIEAVVVEEGGFLGIGGEERRIDWNNLSQPSDNEYLIYSETAAPQQDLATKPAQMNDSIQPAENETNRGEKNRDNQLAKQQDQSKTGSEKNYLATQQNNQQPNKQNDQMAKQQDQSKPGSEKNFLATQQNDQQPNKQNDKMAKQQDPSKPASEKDTLATKQDNRQPVKQNDQMAKQQNRSPDGQGKIEAALAATLLGSKITGTNGETLGTVEQFVFSDMQSDSVKYLVVKGEKDTFHPLPVELVRVKQGDKQVALEAQVDKQRFAQSPAINRGEIMQLSQQQQARDIESYYGISPAWQQNSQGAASKKSFSKKSEGKQAGDTDKQSSPQTMDEKKADKKKQ